jgi:hypothetical protein
LSSTDSRRSSSRNNHPKLKPSRWYYVLGVAVFIAGGILSSLFLFSVLSGLAETPSTQVVVPRRSELKLSETGKYTIFYEYQTVVGNRVYSTGQDIPGIEVKIISKVTGSEIPLFSTSMSSTYTLGSRSGKGLFDFNIDKPGRYELSAFYPLSPTPPATADTQQQKPKIVLAVLHGFVDKLMSTILGVLAITLGSAVAAIVIIAITFLRRRRAKRQLI